MPLVFGWNRVGIVKNIFYSVKPSFSQGNRIFFFFFFFFFFFCSCLFSSVSVGGLESETSEGPCLECMIDNWKPHGNCHHVIPRVLKSLDCPLASTFHNVCLLYYFQIF